MLVWNHTKLWIAVIAGLIVAIATPSHLTALCRILAGWNGAILVLAPLTYLRMRRLDAAQLRAHYEEEDPTSPVILLVVVVAALLSILAIVALLSTAKEAAPGDRFFHLVIATMTIVNSWLLVHLMYTLHYADMYYSVEKGSPPPLTFPSTPEPLFWDFVYFSFTIGVACQTADVVTTQTAIRGTVTFHAMIAFVFNLLILGFAINVSAGLVGK
jgi:uncharacterized membrane protein